MMLPTSPTQSNMCKSSTHSFDVAYFNSIRLSDFMCNIPVFALIQKMTDIPMKQFRWLKEMNIQYYISSI